MKTKLVILTLLLCISGYSQVTDPDMVLIPAGEFNMGKNTVNPADWLGRFCCRFQVCEKH